MVFYPIFILILHIFPGVNREAAFNSLKYFSVSSGTLVPDLIHDILEGALPLEVKLMLKVKGILL